MACGPRIRTHIAAWLEVQLNNNHEELGWLDQDGRLFKMKWIRGVVPNLAAEWIAYKRSIRVEDASLISDAKHKFKMAISNSSGEVVFLWGQEENEAMQRFSLQRSEWRILKFQDRRENDKKTTERKKSSRHSNVDEVNAGLPQNEVNDLKKKSPYSQNSGNESLPESVNLVSPSTDRQDISQKVDAKYTHFNASSQAKGKLLHTANVSGYQSYETSEVVSHSGAMALSMSQGDQLPVSTYSLENSIRPSDLMSTTSSEMRAALEGGDLATGSEIGDDYEANVQFVISSLCENRVILSDVPLVCNRCRLIAATPRDYKTPHLVIVPNEEEQRSLAELSRMIIKQLMKPSSEAEAEADILIVCDSNGDIHATNQTKCSVFCRVPWLRSTPEPFKLEPDKATLIFSLSEYMYKIRFNAGILPKVELDIGNDFKMHSYLIVSITSRKGLEIYQQATNQEQVTCPTGLFKNDWPRTNSISMESVGKSMSDMSVSDDQWFNM